MNCYKYVKEATAVKVPTRSYEESGKYNVKKGICEFYKRHFLEYLNGNESIEELDSMNRDTIKEIVSSFNSDLEYYFGGKWKDCYAIVRGILISGRVYKATAYRKNLPTFHLFDFAKEYLSGGIFSIWREIPTMSRKMQSLINFANESGDYSTENFLIEMNQKCKLW